MAEFEVGHHTYRTDQKLHVFKQAAIVKRIAPLFAGIAGSMSGSPQDVAADVGASVFANMGPIGLHHEDLPPDRLPPAERQDLGPGDDGGGRVHV